MEKVLLSRPWLMGVPGMPQFIADTAELWNNFLTAINKQCHSQSKPQASVSVQAGSPVCLSSHAPEPEASPALQAGHAPEPHTNHELQPASTAVSLWPANCHPASQSVPPAASLGRAIHPLASQPVSPVANPRPASCHPAI